MTQAAEEWRVRQHLLAMRSGDRCECCGHHFVPGRREPSIHHRVHGRHGADPHSLDRVVLVCAGFSRRLAGVLGCHGAIEAHGEAARARGLVVPSGMDPAVVPLVLPSGRVVGLDPTSPFYVDPPGGRRWVHDVPFITSGSRG